jgi:hypothetical protein
MGAQILRHNTRMMLLPLFLIMILSGCATVISSMIPAKSYKVGDDVSCSENQNTVSPVSEALCEQVNEFLHKEAGLPNAKVGFDLQKKGRLQLAGMYQNEDEVERAFAVAQSVVGSAWVSPITPAHIKVEDWQKCIKAKIAGRQCEELDGDELYSLDAKPPGQVREKYALIVGVGRFKNGIKKLNYAVKDAQAIASYLLDPKLGKFAPERVTLLTNEQATSKTITTALEDLENRARPDDLVVVYFSSHGAPPDQYNHVNIVTYDTDLLFGKQPEQLNEREKLLQRQSLWDTSISRQRLHDFFRRIQSKRVLMMLDVCYSGDVFAQIPGYRPRGSEALANSENSYSSGYSADTLMKVFGVQDRGAKDLRIENVQGLPMESVHSKRSKKSNRKNNRTTNAKAKNWGKVIMSASSGKEKSWEPDPRVDPDTPNSYFTHYFMGGLKQTGGRIQDSFNVMVPEVAQIAKQKGVTQQPQYFSIPDLNHWNFSVNSHR